MLVSRRLLLGRRDEERPRVHRRRSHRVSQRRRWFLVDGQTAPGQARMRSLPVQLRQGPRRRFQADDESEQPHAASLARAQPVSSETEERLPQAVPSLLGDDAGLQVGPDVSRAQSPGQHAAKSRDPIAAGKSSAKLSSHAFAPEHVPTAVADTLPAEQSSSRGSAASFAAKQLHGARAAESVAK